MGTHSRPGRPPACPPAPGRLVSFEALSVLQYYIYYNSCGHSDSVHPLHLLYISHFWHSIGV